MTKGELINIKPGVEEEIAICDYSSNALSLTVGPKRQKVWWRSASISLTAVLRHDRAHKTHGRPARRNEWMPEPRNMRCDTQGYYFLGDTIHEELLAGWKPSEGHTEGRRRFGPIACLLAMLRHDLNTCRFAIIAQAHPESAIAGEVAWVPVFVRMFVGSSLQFINEIQIFHRLTKKDIDKLSCLSHKTKWVLLPAIFENGLLPATETNTQSDRPLCYLQCYVSGGPRNTAAVRQEEKYDAEIFFNIERVIMEC